MSDLTPPPVSPDSPEGRGNWWSRRSRRGKVLVVLGALVLLFIAIGALGDPPEDSAAERTTEQTITEAPPATTEAEDEEEDEQPAEPQETEPEEPKAEEPKAPPAVVVRGTGSQVETINLAVDSPAVIGAVHRGSSNFIVELAGPGGGRDLLINTIGNYSGRVVYADAVAGRYRIAVQADGPWTISLSQPVPKPRDKPVPGSITGRGSDVVKIRADADLQPVVAAEHRGQSNFIVELVGYSSTSGGELLFNEIGNYSGETLMSNMPAGSYLVAVQADGHWSLRFTP